MLVKDLMTKDVVTIEANNTVIDACHRYKEFNVGCLVVMNEKLVVGILTERDIIERVIIDHRNPKRTTVDQIMTRNIKTVHASARIEQAAEMMKTYKIKKLPVVLNNEIVGILTATDFANIMPDFANNLRKLIKENKSIRYVAPTP